MFELFVFVKFIYIIFFIVGLIGIFVLPMIIAELKTKLSDFGKRQTLCIIINLLFGFTIIGWFIALYLALTVDKDIEIEK